MQGRFEVLKEGEIESSRVDIGVEEVEEMKWENEG